MASKLCNSSSKIAAMLSSPSSPPGVPPTPNHNTLAPPSPLSPSSAPPLIPGAWSSEAAALLSNRRPSLTSAGGAGGAGGGVPTLRALAAGAALEAGVTATLVGDKDYPADVEAALIEAAAARSAEDNCSGAALTVEAVENLVVARCGVDQARIDSVNPCLMRGIFLGHVKLPNENALEHVLLEAGCMCCGSARSLKCTVEDALFQQPYGGDQYEDGGEGAAVQCEDCGGNFITGLCEGNPSFDSGKFHNHCTRCPNFGTCIGDYREEHCECGSHYFAGSMGNFPCPNCQGQGSEGGVAEMAPPDGEAFDGKIEGVDSFLEDRRTGEMNALLQMIAAIPGAEEAIVAALQENGGDLEAAYLKVLPMLLG